MNKQGQRQTPERTHSVIHWGTALCVSVTVFVSMCFTSRLLVCVCVYFFMHHDVKREKDTIPAEESKRQKVRVEREEGNKEHRKDTA